MYSREGHGSPPAQELPMNLQNLFALTTHISGGIVVNEHFKKLMSTKLCPTFLAYIDVINK